MPQKPKTKNNKRDGSRDADDRLRDLPEWLEDFTDNLEATELHASAHSSPKSDLENTTTVATGARRQCFYSLSKRAEIAMSV